MSGSGESFPILRIEEFEQYLDEHVSAPVADAFTHLSNFSYQEFTAGREGLQTGAVHHGFDVIARLLRISAYLYRDTDDEGDISVRGLRDILLASNATPNKFANLPNGANNAVERHFGLKTDVMPANAKDLYDFAPQDDAITQFAPNRLQFDQAIRKGWLLNRNGTTHKKCPHIQKTTDYFWPSIVNLAADSPRLFFSTIYDE